MGEMITGKGGPFEYGWKINEWISDFVEKEDEYSDKHLNEIYPGIKKKDWLNKTIETIHIIKGLQQYHNVYCYCEITLNSLSHKSPIPSKLNNRSLSSVICPPVFVLENEREQFDNYQYAEEVSLSIGADAYYEEDNSDDSERYDRFIHIRI